jgi:cytochrome bd-type quinol oxidase subunit 1
MLLDRETLEKMRAAAVIESAGDVGARVTKAAGDFAARGVMAKQIEKIAAQERLKHTIAQWAAIERVKGLRDAEIHRKFYLTTGVDVLGALSAENTRQKYDDLSTRIEGWWKV